ncbi:MAG: hypothetical protein KC731_31595 [Myxococcales bacterium]|nr:hypothetical protein [Myxococcales bacterium]
MSERSEMLRPLVISIAVLSTGCPSPVQSDEPAQSASSQAPIGDGMPLAPLRLVAGAPDRFLATRDDVLQVVALATAGQLPLERTTNGYRVLRARPGSVLALAGLREGDELLQLADVPIQAADLLVKLHPHILAGEVPLRLRREGKELRLDYLVIPSAPSRPASPATSGSSAPSDGKPFDEKAFEKAVTQQPDGTYVIARAALQSLLETPQAISRAVRVVPSKTPPGMKLLGLRPGSVLAVLGLRNGDVVLRLNGHDVSTPDHALDAYQALRASDRVDLELVREGQPQALHYRLAP